MAVKTNELKMPNDPVLLLAMVIERIRAGDMRVQNFDLLQRPVDPTGAMELVMRLHPQRRYDYGVDLASPSDDINDVMTSNNVVQTSVGDIIKDIRDFREWRERRDRQASGGMVYGTDAEYDRSNTMAQLTSAVRAGTMSMETFRKSVLKLNAGGQMTVEDAMAAQRELTTTRMVSGSGENYYLGSGDIERAAEGPYPLIQSSRRDGTTSGKRKAAEPVQPPDEPRSPPKRELIFDE